MKYGFKRKRGIFSSFFFSNKIIQIIMYLNFYSLKILTKKRVIPNLEMPFSKLLLACQQRLYE